MDWGTHTPDKTEAACTTCGDSREYIDRTLGVLCSPPRCVCCGKAAWVDRLKFCLGCYFELPHAVRLDLWWAERFDKPHLKHAIELATRLIQKARAS